MSLPKGYKRLEYIQSTGTQYVDTLFKPTGATKVVLDFKMVNQGTAQQGIFGSRPGSSERFTVFTGTSVARLQVDYNTQFGLANSETNISGLNVNQRTSLEISNRLVVNGVQINEVTAVSFTSAYTMYLFANNNAGTAQLPGSLFLYACQVYDNGTLVRDFIPCQNASGAVGLWDAVNDEFYGNAGTGTFAAGPVVPEIVDESEITELEYIQSSGTQYVNSGFIANQDSRLTMDFEILSQTSLDYIFGARSEGNTKMFELAVQGSAWYSGFGTANVQPSFAGFSRYVVDKNKNVTTINGTSYAATANTFTTAYTVKLFALDNVGTIGFYATMKFYACQIYDNGLLERDFVPAMLTNGEVGLYDRVFHEFYRNAGTGEFIAGPEMEHEDYTELEYIESNGAQYIKTDFYPNNNTRVLMNFAFAGAYSGNIGLCGSRTSSTLKTYCFWFYTDYITSCRFDFASNSEEGPEVKLPSGEKLALDINQNTCVCGEFSQSKTDADFQCDYDLALLGINTAGAVANLFTGQIYACQIVENGTEVRIYVPMLHPSGVAGLWDSVNERFYASATTADLIAGPYAATVPKAPSNFRVESETDTMVTLAWDASEEVLGYRLYRQGQLLADTTETSVAVAVEPFAGAVFTVTAYNENGEGAGSALTYFKAPDDPILFLITDRTAQDVTERNPKGYYAASDLNRVGYAVEYLAGRLKESGVTVTVAPVLTWTDMDWGTPTAMRAYLADVQTMRGALKLSESTPTVPADMEKLTYTEANQIEMILLALDAHIREMLLTVDAGWAMGLAYTGLYAKEAYR